MLVANSSMKKSNFFNKALVEEGLISPDRFAPMFGILWYG